MNWQEISDEIFRTLKEKSDGTGHWTASELLRRANMAQRKIVRITNCMTDIYKANTEVGKAGYTKPPLCLLVTRVYLGDKGTRLWPTTIADLDILASTGKISRPWSNEQSDPTNYYDTLSKLYLFPKPSSIKTLYLEIAIRPNPMTDSNSTPFNALPYMEDYHDLIISFVLAKCFLEDRLLELYKEYKQDFVEGIGILKGALRNRPDSMMTFDLVRPARVSNRGPLPL